MVKEISFSFIQSARINRVINSSTGSCWSTHGTPSIFLPYLIFTWNQNKLVAEHPKTTASCFAAIPCWETELLRLNIILLLFTVSILIFSMRREICKMGNGFFFVRVNCAITLSQTSEIHI